MTEKMPQHGTVSTAALVENQPPAAPPAWRKENVARVAAQNRLLRRQRLELQMTVARLGAELERLRREQKL